MQQAPGTAHREGISIVELTEMLRTDDSPKEWWETIAWPGEPHCPKRGSTRTHQCSHKECPYRCTDGRAYFSTKTGTVIEGATLPFRRLAFAYFPEGTSLTGIPSMKLHRDIGATQTTAWFMSHSIHEDRANHNMANFAEPFEVDENNFDCKRKNMPPSMRKELTGRGAASKPDILGVKDRDTNNVTASVAKSTDKET